MGSPLQILPRPFRNVVGRGPCAPPRLSNRCRMLTGRCGHRPLQVLWRASINGCRGRCPHRPVKRSGTSPLGGHPPAARQRPRFTGIFLSFRRAACPQAAAFIELLSYVDGGVRVPVERSETNALGVYPALQHHRRPSLELVGGGVHDAPLHRAVDKRQPLQRLLNAPGLIVGRDAHAQRKPPWGTSRRRLSGRFRMLTAG